MKKLDNMSYSELMDFWVKYYRGGYILARQLFPNVKENHVVMMNNLAHYACNKATFMSFKNPCYKTIYENIFDELPIIAKDLIR